MLKTRSIRNEPARIRLIDVAETRDQRNQRIAQRVHEDDAPFAQPFGERRAHVVLARGSPSASSSSGWSAVANAPTM